MGGIHGGETTMLRRLFRCNREGELLCLVGSTPDRTCSTLNNNNTIERAQETWPTCIRATVGKARGLPFIVGFIAERLWKRVPRGRGGREGKTNAYVSATRHALSCAVEWTIERVKIVSGSASEVGRMFIVSRESVFVFVAVSCVTRVRSCA